MLRHFSTFWNPHSIAEYAYMVPVHLAVVALDVFFALSGFLITGILLDAKGKTGFFRNFYMRRVLRIFPVYYLFLIVWFIVLPRVWPGDVSEFSQPASTQAWYWTYMTNLMIVLKGSGFVPPRTYHLWSLSIEEQFYFLWPAVVYVCSRKTLVKVGLGCIAFSLAFRTVMWLLGVDYEAGFLLLPGRMDPIEAGCVVAVLSRDPAWSERLKRWARPAWLVSFGVIAATIMATGRFVPTNGFVQTLGLTASTAVAVATVMLVVAAAPGTLLQRVLSLPALATVGTISYAGYIFHQPLQLIMNKLGLTFALFQPWFSSRLGAQLAYSASLMAITIAVALLSWHGFEKHMVKLKRFFPYDRRGPDRPVPPPPTRDSELLKA
jgi:peptidoglycan/LPS O-acetylase OafA/YrhL